METTTEEKKETTTEVKEFNPNAFREPDPAEKNEGEEQEKKETIATTTITEEKGTEGADNDNFEFTWEVDKIVGDKPKVETTTLDNGSEQSEAEKNKAKELADKEKTTTFDFAELSKEVGIENASDKEAFSSKVKEILKENSELRSLAQNNVQSDGIKKLEGYKRLEDEALVSQDLKLQGMSDDEIKDIVDAYKTNNTLKIESLKIRKAIDSAINKETQRINDSIAKEASEKETLQKKSREEFQEHLNKTNEMFGFKMGKTQEDVEKARKGLYDYVTSGKFAGEIFANDVNLSQAAYLWRNRETLLKAVKTQGVNAGKKQILDHLHNPEVTDTRRIIDPSGNSNEFNAQKFMSS